MSVAFRVDASPIIGTGHLVRCLALADALRSRGARVSFVCRKITDALAGLVKEKGHELLLLKPTSQLTPENKLVHSHWLGISRQQDAAETKLALAGTTCDWIVVDHYALDAQWESAMRETVPHVMVLDDLADRTHDCDLLLDQNYYRDMDMRYMGKVPDPCRLLLGPRYALLREEFPRERKKVRPRTGSANRVLVFMGGVDTGDYTRLALAAIADLPDFTLAVDVVIGSQHPARGEIEAICVKNGYCCHVQTPNIAELMARADLAIGAGGTATWERCCLGLPALTLCVAENQKKLIEDSSRAGLLYAPSIENEPLPALTRHLQAMLENPGLREFISQTGMALVDGRGIIRVLREMGWYKIDVRPACLADSKALHEWRNHPSVRLVSRHSDLIPFENHKRWLESLLNDNNRSLLIGYCDEQPVGVIRFDLECDCAEVSIYLVPGTNEQGMGIDLLERGERWLIANRPGVNRIRAEVLGNNESSHGLFNAGGYTRDSTYYSKKVR